jgi:hypothetical protein
MVDPIDLGMGFSVVFFSWSPDRALNPQYEDVADVEMAGIIISKDGENIGSCWFDTEDVAAIPDRKGPVWQVHSLDPLHIEPSVQMYEYLDGEFVPKYHGFIREGRWVPA